MVVIIELKCEGSLQDIKDDMERVYPGNLPKPNFATRIEKDGDKFGRGGRRIRQEYVGAHYCCIGFSMHDLTRDYLIGHPAYDAGHPLSAEFRFSGTSLDRLDMLAEEHGLLEDDLVQHRSFDDFMLWWSGFHEVEGCPDCTQDKICISCYDPVTRKKTE